MASEADSVAAELAQRNALGAVDLRVIRATLLSLTTTPQVEIAGLLGVEVTEAKRIWMGGVDGLIALNKAKARAGGADG